MTIVMFSFHAGLISVIFFFSSGLIQKKNLF